MNLSLPELGIAIFFIAVAAALVLLFRRKLEVSSVSRMYRMMARIGVYPRNLSRTGDGAGFDLDAVRKRCRKCPAEDVCERWLAGEIEGDNGFCPNARIFDGVVANR